MRIQYLIVASLALILMPATNSCSGQASAPTDGLCVRKLDQEVHEGEWIRVTSHDGFRTEGRLGTIDFAHMQLMLTPIADAGVPDRSYEFDEIAKLQYRRKGKVKPGYLVGGLLIGAIVGGNIGTMTVGSNSGGFADFSQMDAGFTGAAIGAAAGLLGGTVFSLITESTCTIRCK